MVGPANVLHLYLPEHLKVPALCSFSRSAFLYCLTVHITIGAMVRLSGICDSRSMSSKQQVGLPIKVHLLLNTFNLTLCIRFSHTSDGKYLFLIWCNWANVVFVYHRRTFCADLGCWPMYPFTRVMGRSLFECMRVATT